MKAEEGDGARGICRCGALVKGGVGVPGPRKNDAVLVRGHQLSADALFEFEYQVTFHDPVAAVRSRVLPSVPGIEDDGGQALGRRGLLDFGLLSSLGLRGAATYFKGRDAALFGKIEREIVTSQPAGGPQKKGQRQHKTKNQVSLRRGGRSKDSTQGDLNPRCFRHASGGLVSPAKTYCIAVDSDVSIRPWRW